jgi:murein endopeptidase
MPYERHTAAVRVFAVLALLAGLCLLTAGCGAAGAAAPPADPPPVSSGAPPSAAPPPTSPVPAGVPAQGAMRRSRAIGSPTDGRLVGGVQLAERGTDWLTWDPILKRVPNRPWRRWGTDRLIAALQRVLAADHLAHPQAPPVLVADLSRPHGGVFDRRFGGLGHASHQNGLDVDVMYPRLDGRLRSAWRPDQIDRALAQDLVDRFVAAGAQFVFVGRRVGLRGPRAVVQAIPAHDDHMHVRIPRPRGGARPRGR